MLNMLPKFELVPIIMYFMMLPKLLRPSTMPSRRTDRLLSSRMISAASRATSTAPDDRDADVGGVQRGRVVDTVAQKADDVPARLQRAE